MNIKSNINFQVSILLFIGFLLTLFLFTRDKVVITSKEESKTETASSQTSAHNQISYSSEQQSQIDSLNTLLKGNPNSRDISNELAKIYAEQNDFENLGLTFERLAESENTVDLWNATGDAYFQGYSLALDSEKIAHFQEKSRAAFNQVLKLDQNNLYARTKLAMTFVASDSPMKAIMMLRQVLTDSPDYIPALMNMGALSMQSKQFDKAETRFRHVLKLNPGNVSAKIGLAYSLIELEKSEEAKKLLLELKNSSDIDPVLLEEVNNALKNLK